MPTIFETINQRADNIKAQRWLDYIPLTAFQLTDYDAAADDEEPSADDVIETTLTAMTADVNPDKISTRRSSVRYKQFRVIKRPTEIRAIMHANGVPMFDDDYEWLDQKPIEQQRWCILCKCRHDEASFIHSKRYLNGLSYACKRSLREGWRGHRWRLSA